MITLAKPMSELQLRVLELRLQREIDTGARASDDPLCRLMATVRDRDARPEPSA
jgi:hypothetical protein